MRDSPSDPIHADDSAAEIAPSEASSLEFDDASPHVSRGWRRLPRAARAALLTIPLLLALIVVATQTGQLFAVTATAQVAVTVTCDVPWMQLRLDGDQTAMTCRQLDSSLPPMARLLVTTGSHILNASADGFASQAIPFKAALGTAPFLEASLPLSADGSLRILDATNSYLSRAGYAQRVTLPAALWDDLNLSAPPKSASVTVAASFEAVAMDPLLPTFAQANYLRPVAPQPGTLGAVVAVVEQIVIFDGCSTQPLVRRETAIYSRLRGSVAFSIARGTKTWTATAPYTLTAAASSYSNMPLLTALPATPVSLLALAARSDLASLLGTASALAGTVTTTPVAEPARWGNGMLLSDQRDAASGGRGADWLYLGGLLFNLTANAAAHTPLAMSASSALRSWIASAQASPAPTAC